MASFLFDHSLTPGLINSQIPMANNPTDKNSKGGDKSEFLKELEVAPIRKEYRGSGKMEGKSAIITGGDSGIGRAIAVHFAREGADVAVSYHTADEDAEETKRLVEAEGRRCITFKGDLGSEATCKKLIEEAVKAFGKLDVLVNNAGNHEEDQSIECISKEQLEKTFASNIYSFFYCTKAAEEVMKEGAVIVNTASVVAYRGSEHLLDYAATKGAVVAFTRSLAKNLAPKKIRVNGIAPGPIWTPLVVSSFDTDRLKEFGKDTPIGRAGYPQELGPAYVYLACEDSAYVTGQFIHINGGDLVAS
jgi:NAD(P)-dependent dehydrogenase (short-subunit alcohol dehydrogenase family)